MNLNYMNLQVETDYLPPVGSKWIQTEERQVCTVFGRVAKFTRTVCHRETDPDDVEWLILYRFDNMQEHYYLKASQDVWKRWNGNNRLFVRIKEEGA